MTCEIFDRAGLRTIIDKYLQGESHHAMLLFMLLTIERWVSQFGADGAE